TPISTGPSRRGSATCTVVVAGAGRGAGATGSGLADGLDVDLDADALADQQPAGVEDHVPGEAPVLPVELRGGAEDGPLAPVEALGHARELDVQHDRSRDAVQGQLA